MRALSILKSLVDFIWIVTCIPFLIFGFAFIIYMFFDSSILDSLFSNIYVSQISVWQKQFLAFFTFVYVCASVYVFYLFRKTLRFFLQAKPFDSVVINTYKIMGRLLIVLGLSAIVLMFFSHLLLENRFVIHIGITPYLMLLCLGLFFLVLSECFKIAKQAKEENDLTI